MFSEDLEGANLAVAEDQRPLSRVITIRAQLVARAALGGVLKMSHSPECLATSSEDGVNCPSDDFMNDNLYEDPYAVDHDANCSSHCSPR